jgi:hypothetical protein
MTTVLLKNAKRFVAAALLVMGLNAAAVTIYDNSTGDLGVRFNPGLFEVGDEILLGSSERHVTSFAFEYWALNNGTTNGSFTGIDVRLRFYLNDGPTFNGYATPGTVFYDSGWLDSIVTTPTNRATLNFNQADFIAGWQGGPVTLMPVISNFTWSVQFRNLDGDDSIGLDLYDPPTVGQAINDYWQYNGTSWSLLTNTVAMNFAARMEAAVPEPSGVVLAVLGGLAILLLGRRFRRG